MKASHVHVALLLLLLLAYFDYSLWMAVSQRTLGYGLDALLAGLAALGTLRNWRIARYPVLILALMLALEWGASVFLSVRIGYFDHQSASRNLLALGPGMVLLGIGIYASSVAWRYVGAAKRP